MSARGSRRDYASLLVSLTIGAIFFYAGASKLRDPLEFADSIAAFAILPATLINLLAMGLPSFEIVCGLLLQVPPARRIAALATGLVSLVFFGVIVSALLRGLTIDCGCFGAGAPSRPRMWLELGLDTLLCAGSLFVYLRTSRPSSGWPAA
jgi:putative oxidoreductase